MAKQKHPAGVIGFSVGDLVRYVEFVVSLQRTWRPKGSTVSYGQSVAIPENMNGIIRHMRLTEAYQWLWVQADDHIWEADALRKLLESLDPKTGEPCDVVVPLIIRRGPPFIPVLNKRYRRDRSYMPLGYDEIPTDRVFEVHSAGTGGMLIRRHVIETIIADQGHDRVFEVEKGEKLAEDYFLCRKIRRAGFKIHCDPRVTMGHQGRFAIWPEVYEGHWRLRWDMGRSPDGRVNSFYYGTGDQQQSNTVGGME